MPKLKAYFERYSDRMFAHDDANNSITYGEILSKGREILGFQSQRKRLVFLLLSNTIQSIATYLTAVADGHAVLLLDSKINSDLLTDLKTAYSPDCVFMPEAAPTLMHETEEQQHRPLYADLSVLLSTSGSTGSPKLARFTWRQMEANALAIADYLHIGADERAFLHLPIHYSYGCSIVHSHVVAGACLELTNYTLLHREFWQRLSASQATSLPGVPFHYEMLHKLGLKRLDLASIRTLTQAGGKLSPQLVIEFAEYAEKKGLNFCVMYGQTEAGPRISYCPPLHSCKKPDSIGIPIPGVELSLLNDHGETIQTQDTDGEMVCISPSVMLGYALSAADLALGDVLMGKLITGDIARRDAEGSYTITGRKSRFLKLYGNRVNLDDVEQFSRHNGLNTACVGVDNWLCIAVEASESQNAIPDYEALRSAVMERFKFPPRSFVVKSVKMLPRTESGKILYKALLDMVRLEQSQ
jgi:long-chain acyl-CoA synthetase